MCDLKEPMSDHRLSFNNENRKFPEETYIIAWKEFWREYQEWELYNENIKRFLTFFF